MKQTYFFVDAETDGLYGRFLSVAAIVTDLDGSELDRFYAAVPTTAQELRSDWVKQNVLPYLAAAPLLCADEQALLQSFWTFWMKHQKTALCIAHVPYPVESRLFARCVMEDPENREFLGPFPLYDLATLLASQGMDPNADLQQLSGLALPAHDALNDVRMIAAIWHTLI